MAVIIFTLLYKPMNSKRLNLIEILNEISLAVITETLFLYSPYVITGKARSKLGWLLIGLFMIFSAANIFDLVINVIMAPLFYHLK